MDELLKSQILLDNLARAIAEKDDEKALEYYEQYKKIYEKITGKNLQITLDELKKTRNRK